jgi:hypothetical protein
LAFLGAQKKGTFFGSTSKNSVRSQGGQKKGQRAKKFAKLIFVEKAAAP